ncbi:ArsR family transcriptional regulator [Clostridiales bacterium PH28_bin88]|nr:ArsR family transcriptional regulator [Clostridiales bacterium PH28_bin88]
MDERLLQMEADFLKALAHPTRIRILESLRTGEKCVCEFTEDLDLEQSNTSQHLAVLRRQDIVSCRKEGLKVIYQVNYPEIFQLLDLVKHLLYAQVKVTMDSLAHLEV